MYLDFNNYSFSVIFSSIVKRFDACHSWNDIVKIEIKLLLTIYGPNRAGNHKKSQLSTFCPSVQSNVRFIPWIWNYRTNRSFVQIPFNNPTFSYSFPCRSYNVCIVTLLHCLIVELLNYGIVDVLNCWIVKLLIYWIVEWLNWWIDELVNWQNVKMMNCWIGWITELWIVSCWTGELVIVQLFNCLLSSNCKLQVNLDPSQSILQQDINLSCT